MDLVVHAPGLAEPIMVDLTVVSALTQDALALGSARRDGAAAAAAARRKRARYPGVAVVPFAVEDHGRLGEEALALTRLLAPAHLATAPVARVRPAAPFRRRGAGGDAGAGLGRQRQARSRNWGLDCRAPRARQLRFSG